MPINLQLISNQYSEDAHSYPITFQNKPIPIQLPTRACPSLSNTCQNMHIPILSPFGISMRKLLVEWRQVLFCSCLCFILSFLFSTLSLPLEERLALGPLEFFFLHRDDRHVSAPFSCGHLRVKDGGSTAVLQNRWFQALEGTGCKVTSRGCTKKRLMINNETVHEPGRLHILSYCAKHWLRHKNILQAKRGSVGFVWDRHPGPTSTYASMKPKCSRNSPVQRGLWNKNENK